MIVIFMLCLAALLAVLVLAGHLSEEQTIRDWEMILNPEGARVYDEVSGQLAFESAKVQTSYSDAADARAEGRMDEALRLLGVGSRVVGDCAQSMVSMLRSVGLLARHAAAIAPLPPLRPSGFRARELATLAGLHTLGHHLLMTTHERLALRLAVLRCGVRAAAALLLRTTWRTREAPQRAQGWYRIEALRLDLGTLTEESLASLRAVLASLAGVRRPRAEEARKTA